MLGGGGHRPPERRAVFISELDAFLGPIERILFIPYALSDYDNYVKVVLELGLNAGRELVGIHSDFPPAYALEKAEAVFVGGGNTFLLLNELQKQGLLWPISQMVKGGMPYIGVSAGTNIACPTIATTNDMPIVWPKTPNALDLVPFQINAHFVSGPAHYQVREKMIPYAGETREDRLREFHEQNNEPVLAMKEGSILIVNDSTVRLCGTAGASFFKKGHDPQGYEPGAEMNFLLNAE